MAGKKTLEISLIGGSLALQYFDLDHVAQPIEYYPVCSIKGIIGIPQFGFGTRNPVTNQKANPYDFTDMLNVTLYMEGVKNVVSFDIQQVTNQAGWTPDIAGLNAALADLNTWSECGCCSVLVGMSGQLTSILNAIVASDQDVEILLVRDQAVGNGNPVLKQVTNYQTGTPVITYENVDGTTYVPAPNPIPVYVYLDPSAVLNLILAESILTNTTLTSLNNKFVSVTRTATLLVVSGVAGASVAAGARSVAFFNQGPTDATVAGGVLASGESISFNAGGEDDVLGAIAYVTIATGVLKITTVV